MWQVSGCERQSNNARSEPDRGIRLRCDNEKQGGERYASEGNPGFGRGSGSGSVPGIITTPAHRITASSLVAIGSRLMGAGSSARAAREPRCGIARLQCFLVGSQLPFRTN